MFIVRSQIVRRRAVPFRRRRACCVRYSSRATYDARREHFIRVLVAVPTQRRRASDLLPLPRRAAHPRCATRCAACRATARQLV